jgi:hypothetical protein
VVRLVVHLGSGGGARRDFRDVIGKEMKTGVQAFQKGGVLFAS